MISSRHDKEYGGEEEKKTMKRKRKRGATGRKGIRERERGLGGQSIERERASQRTSGIGKHAHQRSQLGGAPAVGNVQSPTSRARDASGLRLLLLLHDEASFRVLTA